MDIFSAVPLLILLSVLAAGAVLIYKLLGRTRVPWGAVAVVVVLSLFGIVALVVVLHHAAASV